MDNKQAKKNKYRKPPPSEMVKKRMLQRMEEGPAMALIGELREIGKQTTKEEEEEEEPTLLELFYKELKLYFRKLKRMLDSINGKVFHPPHCAWDRIFRTMNLNSDCVNALYDIFVEIDVRANPRAWHGAPPRAVCRRDTLARTIARLRAALRPRRRARHFRRWTTTARCRWSTSSCSSTWRRTTS